MRCCVGYGEQSERRRERGRVKATRADGWWGERASGRAEGISGVGGGEEGRRTDRSARGYLVNPRKREQKELCSMSSRVSTQKAELHFYPMAV